MGNKKKEANQKEIIKRNSHNTASTNYFILTVLASSFTFVVLAMIYQVSVNQTALQQTQSLPNPIDMDDVAFITDEFQSKADAIDPAAISLVESEANMQKEFEEKLKTVKAASPIYQWLKNNKIQVDAKISSREKPADIMQSAQMLAQALGEVINEESFYPNLLVSSDLKVQLIDSSDLDNSFGAHSITGNKIGIAYVRRGTAVYYKQALRNEYFSYQIIAHNILNGVKVDEKKIERLSLPFIDKNGNTDKKSYAKFESALEQDVATIKKYRKLHHSSKTTDTVTELIALAIICHFHIILIQKNLNNDWL